MNFKKYLETIDINKINNDINIGPQPDIKVKSKGDANFEDEFNQRKKKKINKER